MEVTIPVSCCWGVSAFREKILLVSRKADWPGGQWLVGHVVLPILAWTRSYFS